MEDLTESDKPSVSLVQVFQSFLHVVLLCKLHHITEHHTYSIILYIICKSNQTFSLTQRGLHNKHLWSVLLTVPILYGDQMKTLLDANNKM